MAYTNQKAVSSYILLCIKPKLPDTKIGSHRFLDVTGGMDNGFSLQLVPCAGLLLQSRYFEYMQVYALPMGCREVAESKGTMEIVSGFM